MPVKEIEMNKEFWLLSKASCEGEPIYKLFSHRGYSLWWSFRYYPMRSHYGSLDKIKEHYKDFANKCWRLEKPKAALPKAEVLLFDAFVKRKGQKYFGYVPEILMKHNVSALKIFAYTPPPLQLIELQKQDSNNRHLFSFMNKNIETKFKEAKKKGAELKENLLSDHEFDSFLKNSFSKEKVKIVESFVEKACSFYYPRAVCYTELFNTIIKKTEAKVFCDLSHMGVLEYPGGVAARLNGIPRAWIFHGIFTSWKCGVPQIFSEKTLGKSGILLPEKIFSYGKKEIEEIISSGFSEKNIIVAGCPRYDSYKRTWNSLDKKQILQKMGLNDKKHYILWATDAPLLHFKKTNEEQLIASKLSESLRLLGNDYGLIIKKHWFDKNEDKYRNIIKRNPDIDVKIAGPETSVLELIKIAEIVLIKTSTVGIEAIAFNKPIVLMQFEKTFELSYYSDYNFPTATNVNELVRIIKDSDLESETAKFDKNKKFFLKDRMAYFGHSSEIIASELNQMIGRGKEKQYVPNSDA